MKFVTVRDFRSQSRQVWKQLEKQEEMIITSNGKPVALLTSLSDETLENTLKTVRKAKAMAAISSMQIKSMEKGTNKLTLGQINEEISEVRKARKP
jgi:prevent-host-death family protein